MIRFPSAWSVLLLWPARLCAARLVLVCALFAVLPQHAQAAESIRSFDSIISLRKDSRLNVVDTIIVQAERQQIRRGIYRDFSTVREQSDGRLQRVSYDFREITRNGATENYHIEHYPGTIRLFLGDADTLLPVGEHTYVIHYRVDRQIQFGTDKDVLIWNVVAGFDKLPIDTVTATLRLRQRRQLISAEFYAGAFGDDTVQTSQSLAEDRNSATYTRTQVLQPDEVITVRAELEKGAVREPDFRQRVWWYLRDRLEIIGSVLILLVVSLYYVATWLRVGRDPPEGVVVPDWTPPDGISPALANYIQNRGFGSNPFRALSASLVNLAVGGYLMISGFDKTPTITRRDDSPNPEDRIKPSTGEAALLARLSSGQTLQLSKANGKAIKTMVSRFRSAIEREHGQVFFRINRGYCIGGIALSVLGIFALLVLSQGSLANLIPPLLACALFLIFVGVYSLHLIRVFRTHRRKWWRLLISLIPLVNIVAAAAVLAPTILAGFDIDNPLVLLVLSAVVGVNALFFKLMQAPTPLGQQVLTRIEGLKTYLQLAEQDRMNLQGAPKMSPQHFETLLPYAIALDLEKPWSKTFDHWLESSTVQEAAAMRSSNWYGHHGRGFSHLGRDLG
ncbi:MAG: DUF2207 domain-containing protein, partial [Hyphomicrobiales bacterium]